MKSNILNLVRPTKYNKKVEQTSESSNNLSSYKDQSDKSFNEYFSDKLEVITTPNEESETSEKKADFDITEYMKKIYLSRPCQYLDFDD